MGIKRIFVVLLSIGFCFTTFAQGSSAEEAFIDIFTWFNPIMHNAYCQYPIKGSGKISNYVVEEGKLKSYSHSYTTESNNIYLYYLTEIHDSIIYSGKSINILCNSRKKGFPESSFAQKKGINNDWIQSTHYHTYNVEDSILKVNDSIYIYKGTPWSITITKNHWVIKSSYKNGLWNYDILLKNGLPIRIKHNGKTSTYNYLAYDEFDNWIKREVIDDNGISITQTRRIIYSCEYCGGKKWYWNCPKCKGTGRCVPRKYGGPDESVGICPTCGGDGRFYKQECKFCK